MAGTTTISGTFGSEVTLTSAYTTITATGRIVDSGTAVTGNSAGGQTVNNAGHVSGSVAGIHLQGAATDRVINSGGIYGLGSGTAGGGVVLASGGSVTNATAGATISGTQYGVQIRGNTGTIVNDGYMGATLGDGVFLTHGGTVSNAATGVLHGGQTAVYIKGGTGIVINDGLITSDNSFGVDLRNGGTIIDSGTITGEGEAARFAAGYANRLILEPGALFNGWVDGGNTIGSAQQSTLELASGASTGTLSGIYANFEQIVVDAGAVWTVTGTHTLSAGYTLTNSGTLIDAGILTNGGYLTGNGKIVIQSGQTLVDTGAVGSGQTIAFGGNGSEFDFDAADFAGTIGDFQTGETLSLTGIDDVVSYNVVNGNTLDLVRSDNSHIDLTFDRNYAVGNFTVATSGANTVITEHAVTCFAGGTRLDGPDGPLLVEDLCIGDLVLTASGQARPVRWIGRRHLDLTRHPEPKKVQPIRIAAGALDDGLPRRDLLVSPDHAMLLNGLLIPARLLLNGVSIRREERWSSLTYYHVELDSHDVLLAEGAAAESYLDTGNRNTFENAGVPIELHPDMSDNDGQQRREAESCAPFAADAERVEPVWQALLQRALLLGFAMPVASETTSDPALRVEVAGRSFAPVAVEGRRHIFMLPKWHGALRLLSHHAVPSDDRPWVDDQRQLGVKVVQMTLSGLAGAQTFPVDHPAVGSGWWATEHDAGRMARWTDGNAEVAIASDTPCRFVVEVGGTMQYEVGAAEPEVMALCA